MGSNCSCIGGGVSTTEQTIEVTRHGYKKISSTETTLNSVLKIQSHWRGYLSRKKVSIYNFPNLQSPQGKKRESQIPAYTFPVSKLQGNYLNYVVKAAKNEYYKGEWRNKVRHGQGITIYENGDKYVGY